MQTNNVFVDKVTAVMRESDKVFETTGGSARHYVRDVFLPLMEKAGLYIADSSDLSSAIKIITAELQRDKSAGGYYDSWQANIAMRFQDTCARWMEKNKKGFIPIDILHELSNTAAKDFLDLLVNISDAETTKQ